MADPKVVIIDYTNWRGERGFRRIWPLAMKFESNEWHPEMQWLLEAVDIEKADVRTFAMSGVHSWQVPADGLNGDQGSAA